MEPYIRRAEPSDTNELLRLLEQIAEHHRQGRPDIFKQNVRKYSAEELASMLQDKDRPVFVAEDGHKGISGYVFCIRETCRGHAVFQDRDTLYMDDFCVDKNARGQSIGKKLFDAVKDYARSQSIFHLELNVWEFNEGAIRFYQRCGFTTQKRHMEIQL